MVVNAEYTALVNHVRARTFILRKSDRSGVKIGVFVTEFFTADNVCVTVKKQVSLGERRRCSFVVIVTVSCIHCESVEVYHRVVCEDRELKHHLIDLRVTVASDSDDYVLVFVEKIDDLLRGISAGQIVSRTVVEYISKEQDFVTSALLECLDEYLGALYISVNIRCNKKLHSILLFVFTITLYQYYRGLSIINTSRKA